MPRKYHTKVEVALLLLIHIGGLSRSGRTLQAKPDHINMSPSIDRLQVGNFAIQDCRIIFQPTRCCSLGDGRLVPVSKISGTGGRD